MLSSFNARTKVPHNDKNVFLSLAANSSDMLEHHLAKYRLYLRSLASQANTKYPKRRRSHKDTAYRKLEESEKDEGKAILWEANKHSVQSDDQLPLPEAISRPAVKKGKCSAETNSDLPAKSGECLKANQTKPCDDEQNSRNKTKGSSQSNESRSSKFTGSETVAALFMVGSDNRWSKTTLK